MLEVTRQKYALLTALSNAGDKGLSFSDLTKTMAQISQTRFGGGDHVFLPSPLTTVIRTSKLIGQIHPDDGRGQLVLSPRGRDDLAFYERRFAPHAANTPN